MCVVSADRTGQQDVYPCISASVDISHNDGNAARRRERYKSAENMVNITSNVWYMWGNVTKYQM